MQIVIPMSGFGERFRKAGYTIPKPLIKVEDKTIIQHVVEMFSPDDNFIFICNSDHLLNSDYKMEATLRKIAPKGKIISINPHSKGPVYAVLQAINEIDLSQPVIVNYCDFTCYWNYEDFSKYVLKEKIDGAIPAYRGFHPHTLWSNYYAYLKTENNQVYDIQEKMPFTDNPTKEFASSGTYFFKNGLVLREYFNRCINERLMVNNEYYVSMVYKPMIEDGLKIYAYEIEYFMQWGTPEDLRDYLYMSNIFKTNIHKNNFQTNIVEGVTIMPMAGNGSRFANEGYQVPKPLIEISGIPMAVQAYFDLPYAQESRFVLRRDMTYLDIVIKKIKQYIHNPKFVYVESVTEGQAITCEIGMQGVGSDEAVMISACDNGLAYDFSKFKTLYDDPNVDIIVWGARGFPGAIRRPEMYGWIDAERDNSIKKISVKTPLNSPETDPIVVGAFTFKKSKYFNSALTRLKQRNGKINNEFYVDELINDAISLGLRCKIFEIDFYICWGTPDEYKTYQYWQTCFHKWHSHPYYLNLENS